MKKVRVKRASKRTPDENVPKEVDLKAWSQAIREAMRVPRYAPDAPDVKQIQAKVGEAR